MLLSLSLALKICIDGPVHTRYMYQYSDKIISMYFQFQLDEIGDDLTYVGALYDLTEEFNVPVPEEDIQNYDVIMISIK